MKIQKYKCPKKIGNGGDGIMFRIAKGLVAKICYADNWTTQDSRIGTKLYEEGISVPKPYGICPIHFPCGYGAFFEGDTVNGNVMQYIQGKNGYKLLKKPKRLNKAKRLRDIEIERAIKKGFHTPVDVDDFSNFILTFFDNVYLIDFTKWGHKDIPQLPEFAYAEEWYKKCHPNQD